MITDPDPWAAALTFGAQFVSAFGLVVVVVGLLFGRWWFG